MSRAIFFDLDGTLTDSGPGIINCAQLALAHFGIQVPDRDQLRVFVGPPLRQSFARFGVPPASLDEAIARFRARYVPIGKFENTPYPGIAGLLDRLQGAGYRLFVAPSKPQVTAQEVLEHFQLARYFERVCGASLDAGRETKEDVISYLLAQIGDPGQVVMVGDTAFDVLGAKVHGIPTIGVTWGYGQVEAMREAGAADDVREKVLAVTNAIGFSKSGSRPQFEMIEQAVVSDADKLDAMGAVGVCRTVMYSAATGRKLFDEAEFPKENLTAAEYKDKSRAGNHSINHFFDKLLKLKGAMRTAAGKREAERRHAFMAEFLQEFFAEVRMPEWQAYLEDYLERTK